MKQNTVETGLINAAGAIWIPPTATFASAPSSPETGAVYIFTDALTPGAIVGGGTALSYCRWSGSAWVAIGGAGGGGGAGTPAYVSSLFAGPDISKTITGATHGYATAGLLVAVYDNATPRNVIDATWTVNSTTFDVVVSFAESQANYYIVINGATGAAGAAGAAGAIGPPVKHGFGASFFGGAFPAVPGGTAYCVVPVGGTITAWNILVDAGSCTITLWKVARGSALPTVGNSISTSGLAISSGTAIHSTTLTDFTSLTVTNGDIVGIHLQACAGATQINFSVEL